MDSKQPSGNEARVRRTALATVIVLTAAWSSTALGRTQTAADCDAGHDLQNLAAPVNSLILKPVDHVPMEQDVTDMESTDIDKVAADNGTPMLRLGPHSTQSLRGLFEDGLFEDNGALQSGDSMTELSVAPIAESEESPDSPELSEDSAVEGASVEESDLPLLERQMYRIDI